jgi:hypothetical protein
METEGIELVNSKININLNKIDFSKIHNCPRCINKMISITVDCLGNTYCGYCHERINYSVEILEQLAGKQNEVKEDRDNI